MSYPAKEERNKKIINLRVKDPKKWTWGTLGKEFNIHRQTVRDIYIREVINKKP